MSTTRAGIVVPHWGAVITALIDSFARRENRGSRRCSANILILGVIGNHHEGDLERIAQKRLARCEKSGMPARSPARFVLFTVA